MSTKPTLTGGLTRLDEDRALSMADEGGSSAAVIERQEKDCAGVKPLLLIACAVLGVTAFTVLLSRARA